MIRKIAPVFSILSLLALLAGCAKNDIRPGPSLASRDDVAALALAVKALGEEIDEEEAERLARVVYDYTYQLAQEYEIVDPPLVHNTKVNLGIKPRGLCKDWADDIEARLRQEGFESLSLHRAIANADEAFRIEHSTVIVSRRGDGMFEGIVLDPWRYGGTLYWGKTVEDEDYRWVPRREVFAMKLRNRERAERFSTRGATAD